MQGFQKRSGIIPTTFRALQAGPGGHAIYAESPMPMSRCDWIPEGETTKHQYSYNRNPKTITWERLENMRLKKLGLFKDNLQPFNVTRSHRYDMIPRGRRAVQVEIYKLDRKPCFYFKGKAPCPRTRVDSTRHSRNILAPFSSTSKPTCGYFFNGVTNNKKENIGIAPSNLVQWGNHAQLYCTCEHPTLMPLN